MLYLVEKNGKPPTEKSGITGTFNYAMRKAREQKWSKIVIIGMSADGERGKTVRSRMSNDTAIGLISRALHVTLRDSCDGEGS